MNRETGIKAPPGRHDNRMSCKCVNASTIECTRKDCQPGDPPAPRFPPYRVGAARSRPQNVGTLRSTKDTPSAREPRALRASGSPIWRPLQTQKFLAISIQRIARLRGFREAKSLPYQAWHVRHPIIIYKLFTRAIVLCYLQESAPKDGFIFGMKPHFGAFLYLFTGNPASCRGRTVPAFRVPHGHR